MDSRSSDQITAGFTLVFIVWLLMILLGGVRLAIGSSMEGLGQLGDFFGVFNSGLGMMTAYVALKTLTHAQNQNTEQRNNFQQELITQRELVDRQLDQQRNDLLRVKAESLIVVMSSYQHLTKDIPFFEPQMFQASTAFDLMNRQTAIIKEISTLMSLYFSDFKSMIEPLSAANEHACLCLHKYLVAAGSTDNEYQMVIQAQGAVAGICDEIENHVLSTIKALTPVIHGNSKS